MPCMPPVGTAWGPPMPTVAGVHWRHGEPPWGRGCAWGPRQGGRGEEPPGGLTCALPLQVHPAAGLCQLRPATFLDQCQRGPRPLSHHDSPACRDRRAPGVPSESWGSRLSARGQHGVGSHLSPGPQVPQGRDSCSWCPKDPRANNENDLGSAECSLNVSTRSARDVPLCQASHNSVHVRKLRHREGK